jgi:predicted transcriptional regulator
MKKMRHITVPCGHCGGKGRIPLTGVYAATLELLRLHGPVNGAALARLDGCKATAMNNRLAVLATYGLVACKRNGREKLYSAKER